MATVKHAVNNTSQPLFYRSQKPPIGAPQTVPPKGRAEALDHIGVVLCHAPLGATVVPVLARLSFFAGKFDVDAAEKSLSIDSISARSECTPRVTKVFVGSRSSLPAHSVARFAI